MKFSIIHIEELSGEKAQVYSVKYEGKDVTELRSFITKYQKSHQTLIYQIAERIRLIAQRDGVQSSFFKRESSESHNVFRLLETNELRIYCIMFNDIILLFGAGGKKTKGTKKNAENPPLQKEIDKLIAIENAVATNIKNGALKLTCNGFEGNLKDIQL